MTKGTKGTLIYEVKGAIVAHQLHAAHPRDNST